MADALTYEEFTNLDPFGDHVLTGLKARGIPVCISRCSAPAKGGYSYETSAIYVGVQDAKGKVTWRKWVEVCPHRSKGAKVAAQERDSASVLYNLPVLSVRQHMPVAGT